MDILAVRELFKYCREYTTAGNGPMFVEIETYRYRSEVQDVRKNRDAIALLKSRILETGVAIEKELKAIEKSVRAEIDAANQEAKNAACPEPSELYSEIYWQENPEFIRGVELGDSVTF